MVHTATSDGTWSDRVTATDILRRNNVSVTGNAQGRTVVLAYGFGCDRTMWRLTVPALTDDYRVVLFDYVGSGRAGPSAFSEDRYASLAGYAQDAVDVCEALDLRDAMFVETPSAR